MKLLDSLDANPFADHSFFLLCDDGRADVSPLDDLPEEDRLVYQGNEAIVLGTAASRFYPEVRVEVWDEEPPPPTGEWDAIEDGSFRSPTRVVSLWGPAEQRRGAVRVPAERLRVRAACKGRSAAEVAVDETDDDVYGVEIWVLQLWPAL